MITKGNNIGVADVESFYSLKATRIATKILAKTQSCVLYADALIYIDDNCVHQERLMYLDALIIFNELYNKFLSLGA